MYEKILFDVLINKGLKVESQVEYTVLYKGNKVGLFRTDLIVGNRIILELKVVPEIFALHQAQTISYLKVTGLRLAMLINFGGAKIYIKTFPSKFWNYKDVYNYRDACKEGFKEGFLNWDDKVRNSFERRLIINFDINKVNLSDRDKKLIFPYLKICKEILEILGPGYFHQVYRRAFWNELIMNNINFEWIKQLELKYQEKVYDHKDVKFFKINNLLISTVAVNSLNNLVVNRFSKYVRYYKCSKGLIINFNNTILDFRYLE